VLMPLENEELLKKYFPNIHFGMRYAFEAFSNILQNSLADLKTYSRRKSWRSLSTSSAT